MKLKAVDSTYFNLVQDQFLQVNAWLILLLFDNFDDLILMSLSFLLNKLMKRLLLNSISSSSSVSFMWVKKFVAADVNAGLGSGLCGLNNLLMRVKSRIQFMWVKQFGNAGEEQGPEN